MLVRTGRRFKNSSNENKESCKQLHLVYARFEIGDRIHITIKPEEVFVQSVNKKDHLITIIKRELEGTKVPLEVTKKEIDGRF